MNPNNTPHDQQNIRLRILEVGLVLLVCFGYQTAFAIWLEISGTANPWGRSVGAHIAVMAIKEVGDLCLVAYVLSRSHRTYRSLGFDYDWKDPLRAIPIGIVAYVASMVMAYGVMYGNYLATGHMTTFPIKNVQDFNNLSFWPLLTMLGFCILNPFAEELIVRAYLQTEVAAFAKSPAAPIMVSVLVQCAYHMYQGYGAAISYIGLFGVFSLYYAKTGRITPIIIAHMLFDLLAILSRQGVTS